MTKINFCISNRDGTLMKMEGRLLDHDLIAHKSPSGKGWRVSDFRSGFLIRARLANYKECKQFVKEMSPELLGQINKVRSTERYQRQCEKVKEFLTL